VPKDKPAVVIGDQFFTDGLYAKWNNLKFIKVEPLSPKDAAHTKVTRWLEKILFTPTQSRLTKEKFALATFLKAEHPCSEAIFTATC